MFKLQKNLTVFLSLVAVKFFKQTIDIADRLELTHVELDVQGDAHYPAIPAAFKKSRVRTTY